MAIFEFQTLDKIRHVPDAMSEFERYKETVHGIKQNPPMRHELIPKINNYLVNAASHLQDVARQLDEHDFASDPTSSEDIENTMTNLETSIEKLSEHLQAILQHKQTLESMEEKLRQAADAYNKAMLHIDSLIGKSTDPCIRRNGAVMRAMVCKDVLPKIVRDRFANIEDKNPNHKQQLDDMIIELKSIPVYSGKEETSVYADRDPSDPSKQVGITPESLMQLAERLLAPSSEFFE